MARVALTPQVSGAIDVAPEYRLEEIEVEAGLAGARAGRSATCAAMRSSSACATPTDRSCPSRPATPGCEVGRRDPGAGPAAHPRAPRGHARPAPERRDAVTEPLAALRDALDGAVADVAADAGPPASAPALERPRQADHGDYATNAAMLLAPALGAPPREIAERLADALAARLGPALERVEVAGPGFLNLFARRRLVRRRARGRAGRRRRLGRRRRRARAVGQRRVRQREPDRARCTSAAPATPPTATRSRGCSAFVGHGVAPRVLRQRLRHPGRAASASRSARARAARSRPDDGYEGEYVAELAARDRGRRRPAGRRARAARRRADGRAGRAQPRALPRRSSTTGSASARCTRASRARSSTRSTSSTSRGARSATTARCGCARPTSATTRTACSSAPAASTPTSPPTSPTTRTSASAASTG